MCQKEYCSLDRFEGELAVLVCDDGRVRTLPREELGERREGDVFSGFAGALDYEPEETERRRIETAAKLNRLIRRKENDHAN